jgi:hypothetical protein
MRLAALVWRVIDQGIGQAGGILRDIQTRRIQSGEGIERGRRPAGDAEGVEDVQRAGGEGG